MVPCSEVDFWWIPDYCSLTEDKILWIRTCYKPPSAWLPGIMQNILGNLHLGLALGFHMRLKGPLLTQKQHEHLTLTQEFSKAQWDCQFSIWVLTNWKNMTEKLKFEIRLWVRICWFLCLLHWLFSCERVNITPLLNSHLICRFCQHDFLSTQEDEPRKYVKLTSK